MRVPEPRWVRALAIARKRGESLSQVINDALDRYADEHESAPEPK